ncbi:MAG TPA: gamma-glutamyltransferase family protein [Alphaproteobacteria bacterium]|nr:gamma-glutamyltransferase family protein [Alphaproteobacteria bacterium]
MQNSVWATRGMVVAPHALAAQAGVAILRDGGSAIEAMITAAAVIAVVYPHMNSIGGDSFWLIMPPDDAPYAIEACGPAAARADIAWYRDRNLAAIPDRGPFSANTMAGTVGGWALALQLASRHGGSKMAVSHLLRDAITYGRDGFAVTASQAETTRQKIDELRTQPGFADAFLMSGAVPAAGSLMRQSKLAATLEHLASSGLESYYRGDVADAMAKDLADLGSPLRREDFADYRARLVEPVRLQHSAGNIFNMTLPTQGVISLAILGIAERAGLARLAVDSADYVHCLVEATKQAFVLRDRYVTDPAYAPIPAREILDDQRLSACAARIDPHRAKPWRRGQNPSDTVWMGAVDRSGLAVSFIQSIYHEFGSGVVLPSTGVNWQNRGSSFRLDPTHLLALAPGKRPLHTLNPAAAHLTGGRNLVYGTMGGDGQPQTQAIVFSRIAVFGQSLQQSITGPRWLLGRTWGQNSDSLKMENRFGTDIVEDLRGRGHDVEVYPAFSEVMGHAGAILRRPDGVLEGAYDPRSNGAASGF